MLPPMDPARIDARLATMTPEEIAVAMWMIDVFDSWNMTRDEADEWRRRIRARWEFLGLSEDPGLVS